MSFYRSGRTRKLPIQRVVDAPPIDIQTFPGFYLEVQEYDKWCWVAVSQGYINCVLGLNPQWSQSKVAAAILQNSECEIYPERFNREHNIYVFWDENGHLTAFIDRAWTAYGARLFVDGEGIGLCQIEWEGGVHHYVLVVGWEKDGEETILHVCDPLVGGPPEAINHRELRDAYQRDGMGKWVCSGRLG